MSGDDENGEPEDSWLHDFEMDLDDISSEVLRVGVDVETQTDFDEQHRHNPSTSASPSVSVAAASAPDTSETQPDVVLSLAQAENDRLGRQVQELQRDNARLVAQLAAAAAPPPPPPPPPPAKIAAKSASKSQSGQPEAEAGADSDEDDIVEVQSGVPSSAPRLLKIEEAEAGLDNKLQFVESQMSALKKGEADLVEQRVRTDAVKRQLQKRGRELDAKKEYLDRQEKALAEKGSALKALMTKFKRTQASDASAVRKWKRRLNKRDAALTDRERRATAREQSLADALHSIATREHTLRQLEERMSTAGDRLNSLLQQYSGQSSKKSEFGVGSSRGNVDPLAGATSAKRPTSNAANSTESLSKEGSLPSPDADDPEKRLAAAIQNLLGDDSRPVLKLARPSPTFSRRVEVAQRKMQALHTYIHTIIAQASDVTASLQVFADACGTLSTTLLSPQPPTGAAVLGAVGRACLAAVGRVLRETAAFQEILATSLQHSLVNPLAKLVDTGFADSAALSEEAHRRRSHSFEDNNRDGRKGSENSAATRLALVGDLAVRCNALATAQRVQDEIERQKCLHLAAGWNFDAKDGDDHLAPSSVAVKVPQSESGSLAPIGGPSTTSHTASGSTTRNKSKRKSLEEEMIDEKLRHARCNLVVRRHDVVTATREAVSHARIVVSESSVNAVLALNNWAQQLWQVIRGSNAVVAQSALLPVLNTCAAARDVAIAEKALAARKRQALKHVLVCSAATSEVVEQRRLLLPLMQEYSRSKRGFGGFLWECTGAHYDQPGSKAWWHVDFQTGRLYKKSRYDSESKLKAELLLSTVKPFYAMEARRSGGVASRGVKGVVAAVAAAAASVTSGHGQGSRLGRRNVKAAGIYGVAAASRGPEAAYCFEIVSATSHSNERLVLQALSANGYEAWTKTLQEVIAHQMANPPLGEQDLAAAAASNSTLDSKSELESASSNSAAGSQIAPCEDMDASLGQSMLAAIHSLSPFCADCGVSRPEWISCSFGVCICLACVGIHRSIEGNVLKSLRLDVVPRKHLLLHAELGGNELVNTVWEPHLQTGWVKPSPHASMEERRRFILV
eukprot:INCI14739.4.p1 GENE.INCI14739.4~~INCI14739.4.p1  ORF type:complete len:1079 (-),score=224.50 INCI14739.4:656-3892(-)